MRALLVEDEKILRGCISEYLSLLGFDVDVVCTGRPVYLLGTMNYDLILLDNLLPDMTGIEALRLSQALGNQSKVLLMTGNSDLALKDYEGPILRKPFDIKTLTEYLVDLGFEFEG